MFDPTRREWLIQSLSLAGAAFVAQLPPQFSTPAPPACDPSTKTTPARKTPGPSRQPSAPGATLFLEGYVIGIRCGVIAGATVTAWIDGARTVATTDATGRYKLNLVLPKVAAPRVNLRVDVPPAPGRKPTTLTTFLFLPDEIARAENAKAAGFDPLLRMKLLKQAPQAVTASFDVILDL